MIAMVDPAAEYRSLKNEIDAAVGRVFASGRFILGPEGEALEREIAAFTGARHAVGCNSGTDALFFPLLAAGIGPGDEVIVPANTFVATATAVVAVGATPVFIDVEPATLLMTAASVEAALSARTAAVIPVHLYGQPVDMDAINQVAGAAGIEVIEDACQAHGATWRGRPVGTLGRIGCFSFYPGKNLGAFGDAGAVVTNDHALAERVRSISNYGRKGAPYHHEVVGTNKRLDGLQGAILSVKLKRLAAWTEGRRRAAARYEAALAELPVSMVQNAAGAFNTYHLAVIRTAWRDELRERLASEGISTGIHYPIPCHLQPAFASADVPSLPVAERAAEQILSLPMHPHLSDADIAFIAEAIDRALTELEPIRALAS
jgi:dTDP-4-amino-4,6-dideoxygalactose transaminase